jgi:hypothetical protein
MDSAKIVKEYQDDLLKQYEEDGKLAGKKAAREDEKAAASEKTKTAREESAYFGHVIEYYNAKLTFFKQIDGAFDETDTSEAALKKEFAAKTPKLKTELAALRTQKDAIDTNVEKLSFQEFLLKNKHAEEDDAQLTTDVARLQKAYDAAAADFTNLDTKSKGLTGAKKTAMETARDNQKKVRDAVKTELDTMKAA